MFIDGYRPIFAEKFKTENHPLLDKLGIDDPGHPHYKNNSDVVQDFAALAAKHQREYEQQMAAPGAAATSQSSHRRNPRQGARRKVAERTA